MRSSVPPAKSSLKQLATSHLGSDRFLEELKYWLLSDFGRTFEVLKTQKLLTKTRELTKLQNMSQDINNWLKTAPLSGKKKARPRRHTRLCEIFSEPLMKSIISLQRSKHGKSTGTA